MLRLPKIFFLVLFLFSFMISCSHSGGISVSPAAQRQDLPLDSMSDEWEESSEESRESTIDGWDPSIVG